MGHAPFQSVKCGQDCVNEDGIKGRASLTAAETFIMSGGGGEIVPPDYHITIPSLVGI